MARSNRKTVQRTATSTARTGAAIVEDVQSQVREVPTRAARSIKNYTFEYQRDRVSRRAGSSYFRLESNNNGKEAIQMTLQEAQSLYNFLGNALGNNS